MSGYTVQLVTGLAELLAAGGAGTWSPTEPTTVEPVIVVGPHLPQTPDRIVCLTPYPVADEPGTTEVVIAVQVRCRGDADPRTAEDMADVVYGLLHGAGPLLIGTDVTVAQMWRQSSAPLGPDTNHRAERSDNYYIQANRATAYNTD